MEEEEDEESNCHGNLIARCEPRYACRKGQTDRQRVAYAFRMANRLTDPQGEGEGEGGTALYCCCCCCNDGGGQSTSSGTARGGEAAAAERRCPGQRCRRRRRCERRKRRFRWHTHFPVILRFLLLLLRAPFSVNSPSTRTTKNAHEDPTDGDFVVVVLFIFIFVSKRKRKVQRRISSILVEKQSTNARRVSIYYAPTIITAFTYRHIGKNTHTHTHTTGQNGCCHNCYLKD